MHNNFYLLRQLVPELNEKLTGHAVVSCFSQNKDELIIGFDNGDGPFFIKAQLHPFPCLTFPGHFNRARKNSVDLFGELILKKVTGTTQFDNERSFSINVENGYSLVFKMHGHHANILLAKGQQVVKIFRNQFTADKDIVPSGLHRTIDWGKDFFVQNRDKLKQAYFTLGKTVWEYLDARGFNTLGHDQRWELLNETVKQLEAPTYYITKQNGQIRLSLLNHGEVLKVFAHPIEALNEFFHQHHTTGALHKEKTRMQKKLIATIGMCGNYMAKNRKKLDETILDAPYKSWADILMANLHQVEKGSKKVQVMGFDGKEVTIPLKPGLNAQQNAQVFYRKAKNQEIEIKKLSGAMVQKENEMEAARQQLVQLEEAGTWAEFKLLFKGPKTKAKKESEPPFHQVGYMGYKIWIGKNAQNNDLLTLKYAHKDDLWLHAKDVSGSHVVVKNQAGKAIPKEVVVRAAELAAYNSKRKTES
nr:NFACT RNA binding domain-containing protein [Cyclobacteriaceae bacterium]